MSEYSLYRAEVHFFSRMYSLGASDPLPPKLFSWHVQHTYLNQSLICSFVVKVYDRSTLCYAYLIEGICYLPRIIFNHHHIVHITSILHTNRYTHAQAHYTPLNHFVWFKIFMTESDLYFPFAFLLLYLK